MGDGSSEPLAGFLRTTGLHRNHAEQMQCIRLFRVLGHNRAANLLRRRKLPPPAVIHRAAKLLLNIHRQATFMQPNSPFIRLSQNSDKLAIVDAAPPIRKQ